MSEVTDKERRLSFRIPDDKVYIIEKLVKLQLEEAEKVGKIPSRTEIMIKALEAYIEKNLKG